MIFDNNKERNHVIECFENEYGVYDEQLYTIDSAAFFSYNSPSAVCLSYLDEINKKLLSCEHVQCKVIFIWS